MQRHAIRLAMPALCALAPAVASSQPEVTLEKVQVTGSNIPRIESESATPTLVLTRQDIERTGLTTVKEVLDSLVGTSQLTTGPSRTLSDITGSNSYAAGSSAVSLRFLGPQATLVLLNSRRLSPYAMHDDPFMVTDVNALPLAAVERIEVLRSGGAAVYGSDAIAGVINVITRQETQGLQLSASREAATGAGELNATTFGITAGVGKLAEDRFNLTVSAEYYKRSSVMWNQVMNQVDRGLADMYPSFGSPSFYSFPGNNFETYEPFPGCTNVVDGLCAYDRYQRFEVQPSSERANLLLSGRLQLDATLQAFSEVLLSHVRTGYTLADPAYGPADSASWFDPSTGRMRTFVHRGLPAGHPLNTTGADEAVLAYRFADANSRQVVESGAYRAMTGLRGTHRGFDWESALGVAGSRVENRVRGAFSDSGFRALIGDYDAPTLDPSFFNGAYRIGGPNSAAVLDRLFPEFTHTGRLNQVWVDGKANGTVGRLGDRPIDVAFGFDLRHERLSITPSANLASGDIVGYGVAQTEGRRTFGAVFTEASLPVTERLEVQAAARLDKYPNFDVNLSPKVGLRFEATPQLMLRGTVEAGFRAPNLVESASTTLYSYDNGLYDPKRCPPARRLAADLMAQANGGGVDEEQRRALIARAQQVESLECQGGVAAARAANTELKPEKSLGSTLGLVFQPARNLALEVDAWRIERRDEIEYPAQNVLLAEDAVPGSVDRLPLTGDRSFTDEELAAYGVTAGALSATHSRFQNNTRTLVQGLDLAVTGRTPTPLGAVSVSLQSSFLDTYRRFSTLRQDYGDNLAGRYGFPRWRAYLVGALDSGAVSNALRLNYLGKTSLQGDWYDVSWSPQGCELQGIPVGECDVEPFLTLDWNVTWRAAKGLVLGLNVRNLFDTRPPRDWRALGESGFGVIPQSLAEAYGRTVRLSVAYAFD